MDENLKNMLDSKQGANGFIKVTDLPVDSLTDPQKVALNRKANMLFNEGKTGMAERIFVTTGYSDGLSRIGDVYLKSNDYINALKFYSLAHNARKAAPVIEKIAGIVSLQLKD
ncbi:MAG: hypothetical protein J6Z17_01350 [Treponema sp.]|nr:hypothetical protein [Treponema sp.]